jgi:hypothetical protein
MPTGVVAGHLLLLFIGLRSDTAQAATPNGWTFLGGVNGGGGTFGASQGPSRMTVFYRIATGSGDTPGAVTLTSTDMAFCQVIRLTNATGNWSVAGASGSDSTVGAAWSVACDVNPGITAGDFCVVGSTNAQAASTWSAQAIAATGVTAWGTATEINEFNSTLGNDINGNTFYRAATTGTATAAPTVTATLAGTTTNARGVSFLVRAREVAAAPPVWDTSVTDRVTTMTGVVGRWRAAELGTVGGGSLADGAAVTSWPAKGVGGTLTGTGTFVASSKINQRPAIRFNGTSNKFVSPTITATTNRTIGIVLVPSSVTTQQELISIGNNEVIIQTNGAIHLWVGAGVDSAASTMVVNAADVVTASASTTANDTVHKDGTQVINAAIGTPSSTAGFELGAQGTGRWLNGDMAELVIWDHVLSTAERATWHSYVQDAYGVTVTDYVSSSVTHSSTLAATASASATVGGVTVPAAPTTITNPERGFFYYSETHAPGAAATTYNALSQTTLESERATNGRTLVFRYVILDQFLGTDTISAGFIASGWHEDDPAVRLLELRQHDSAVRFRSARGPGADPHQSTRADAQCQRRHHRRPSGRIHRHVG